MEYLETAGTILVLLERFLTTADIAKRMVQDPPEVSKQAVLDDDDDDLVQELLRTLITENLELRAELDKMKNDKYLQMGDTLA